MQGWSCMYGVQIGSGAIIGMLSSVECLRFIIMNLQSKQSVQLKDFSPAVFGWGVQRFGFIQGWHSAT